MASGILGSTQTTASVAAVVYTVPSGKTASLTINIVNTSDIDVLINYVALSTGSSPTVAQYIEYNVYLPSGNVLERTGLVLDAAKTVTVLSSAPVSVNVYGYEE